ncbi:hypothetical protein SRHO_G00194010 [Serrasalmus rhombeus]
MDYRKNRNRTHRKKERIRSEPFTEVKKSIQENLIYPSEDCTAHGKEAQESDMRTEVEEKRRSRSLDRLTKFLHGPLP